MCKVFWTFFLIFLGNLPMQGLSYHYRAVKYGRYYSSKFYANSRSTGQARYSRVYSGVRNHYYYYYTYMFKWMNTDGYKVYKSSVPESISICKNYEANENGTFLGVFTCPLPFEPSEHAYCCGVINAQYCCAFWDIPLNFAAAVIAGLIAVGFIGVVVYMCVFAIESKKRGLKVLIFDPNRRGSFRRFSCDIIQTEDTSEKGCDVTWSVTAPSTEDLRTNIFS